MQPFFVLCGPCAVGLSSKISMSICERQSGGRILCIRLSGFGDVVHALNALTLLRRERPDAHIGWVVEDRFADLLKDHPYIDELFVVPRRKWGRLLRNPLRWAALRAEGRVLEQRLRDSEFDVSVDFQSSLKSSWLVWAARAPLRVGFGGGVSRELCHLIQNLEVEAPLGGVHRIERNLALLAGLGIPTRYASPVLACSGENARPVDATLEERLTGGPTVVIHPGTSQWAAFKRWLPGRYARVADRLAEENGADVLVSYGPKERELAEEVVLLMKRPGILAPPTANLQQLVRLLARADLFIGSDTGPMHLASALGVPVVALLGPKDPVQTGPFCSRSVVVTGRVPCRPCTRRRCGNPLCMTSITSSQVLRAARRVLAGEGARRADAGVAHRPFTRPFRLGPRAGRISTAYSYPEFFTSLCRPSLWEGVSPGNLFRKRTPLRRDAGATPRDAGATPRDATATPRDAGATPGGAGEASGPRPSGVFGDSGRPPAGLQRKAVGPEGRTFLAARWRGVRRRARRAWKSLVRLRRLDAPVPFPVCYMERPDGLRWDQLLVTEHAKGAVPLPEWLSARWWDSADDTRESLLGALAAALYQLHRTGSYHGDLRAGTTLVCGGQEGPVDRVVFTVSRPVRRMRFLPALARAFMSGLELGRLARSLKPWFAETEMDRLCREYRERWEPEYPCRSALEVAFRWRKEKDSWLKRFL